MTKDSSGEEQHEQWLGKLQGTKEYAFDRPALHTEVFGLQFANPIGLAAGFDKHATALPQLASLGFGFLEVGTVTPKAQPGNPKPRMFRIPEEQAMLNRMGFNSNGAEWLAEKLNSQKLAVPLGINIGKNKDTSNERATEDYVECFRMFAQFAEYIAINVSSPNTPGLRDLQEKAFLQNLLARLPKQFPVFVKIAPELSNAQLQDIADAVGNREHTGIIATNTLKTEEGGISGKPLRNRSTHVIRELYRISKGEIPIIGVGGIFSADDAYEKIRAGSCLVQLYTGLEYQGPGLIKKLKQGLVELLQRDGFASVGQAVGKDNV